MDDALMVAESYGARALTYRFLARLYLQEPDAAWLGGLYAEGLLSDFPVAPGTPEMKQGLALLTEACRRLALHPDGAESVRADYTRLFFGPEHLLAPPWESVYRTDERLLCGWPTMAVHSFYRQCGLEVQLDGEPGDHIGLELLFLAELCDRGAKGDSARSAFLQEHLLQWAPAFAADLRDSAATDLYRGLALLTIGFLSMEQQI